MVIDVVISSSGMPSNRVSKSASESVATPHRPTSPSLWGSSESRPIRVGMSKATESPPCPWPAGTCSARWSPRRSRSRRTAASSRAGPGTSWGGRRGCTGTGPGSPRSRSWSKSSRSSDVYSGSMGSPEMVSKSASRSAACRYLLALTPRGSLRLLRPSARSPGYRSRRYGSMRRDVRSSASSSSAPCSNIDDTRWRSRADTIPSTSRRIRAGGASRTPRRSRCFAVGLDRVPQVVDALAVVA